MLLQGSSHYLYAGSLGQFPYLPTCSDLSHTLFYHGSLPRRKTAETMCIWATPPFLSILLIALESRGQTQQHSVQNHRGTGGGGGDGNCENLERRNCCM